MTRRWTVEEAKAIQAAALADWEAGNVNKEFTEKQWERGVSDSAVERVLKSNSTLIARFYHTGQPRYGFWHPPSEVLIIWQPVEEGFQSELKSCLPHEGGNEYLQRQTGFQPVRWEVKS